MEPPNPKPGTSIIRQKVLAPGLPTAAITRPRLDALYARLLDEHEALAVFATAGSGKTIQAQLFASHENWPLAWLTLDGADRSASRMLSYLARALSPHVPGIEDVVEAAFASGPVPEVAAALLAEAIDVPRLLIVFDQCEAVADASSSCSALETFIDYLPHGARALLLSRREMSLSLGRLLLHGRVGRITDADLAVTADEAELFLRNRADHTDVNACLERTRGWFAAVAFGGPARPGGHDPVRDFGSYIAAEVFDLLDADERQFLLDTSILDAVSLRGAIALCGPEAPAMWHRVRMRHLPATVSTDGTIFYHPCFRQFLRERLELTDPSRLNRLRQKRVELLLQKAHYEEAAELQLERGDLDGAVTAIEQACATLVDRCDWDTLLRWADAVGRDRLYRSPALLCAVIPALRSARRIDEAQALIRELHADGQLTDVLAADDRVITHVAWSMLWSPREGLAMLDRYDAQGRATGARYMLEVTSGSEPVDPPRGVRWTDVDRLVSWGLMVQGRLDDLVAMQPTEDQWPPRTPYTTPHPLLGLVWRGEVGRARELFDQVPEAVRRRFHTDLWHYLEAWLLLAEDDPAGSLAAARQAIVYSRRTRFGFEPVFQIVEAEALLHLGRVDDAVAVLEASIESSRASGLRAYQEWGQTLLGHALLLKEAYEQAVPLLTSCVESMSQARRLLLLPAAATFLAEAHRRLGQTKATRDAADRGHQASVRMGAFFGLKRALQQFPQLAQHLQRRADAAKWLRVANGPVATVRQREPESADSKSVLIQPFGTTPDILVNGRALGVRRLKTLELACFLAARPTGVARGDILIHLFPDSDRSHASNHLRQVVHQLRKTTGLTLQRLPTSEIAWSDAFVVDTVDLRFERAHGKANGLAGQARLRQLCAALELVADPYLASSELEWVSARRFELDVMVEESELEAARLALELGEFDCARGFAERTLARDPYSEPAYRILIEIDMKIGTETSAMATYRRAVAALGEIGLSPAEPTVRLLRRPTSPERQRSGPRQPKVGAR